MRRLYRRGFGEETACRNSWIRFIDSIEWIAAFFIGVVALDVFVSIVLRYFFGYTRSPTPMTSASSARHRDLLGHRGDQPIAARISPSICSGPTSAPSWQRIIDVFATLVLLFVVTVQTYTLFDKVSSTYELQPCDLRSAIAGLAVLRGRMDRRRRRRAADRRADLSADLPSGTDEAA